MLKKTRMLAILFMCSIVFLTGCGGTSLPYKKDDVYKEDGNFVEVLNENEWKAHEYRDNENQYALYKIEPTEYYSGKYTVVRITKKQSYGGSDAFMIRMPTFCLLSPIENGFAMKKIGTEKDYGGNWKEFKMEFDQAKDKEAFLEEKAVKSSRKFIKTN